MRIKTVKGVRKILNMPLIGSCVLAILMVWVAMIVSLRHVMMNAMAQGGFSEDVSYVFTSFIHSRAIVQILAYLIAFCTIMLCALVSRKYVRKLLKTNLLGRLVFLKRTA